MHSEKWKNKMQNKKLGVYVHNSHQNPHKQTNIFSTLNTFFFNFIVSGRDAMRNMTHMQ